jgi:predicted acetyltransferase
MEIQIIPAGSDDKTRLLALFELYAYDFSEMLDIDVGDDGRFRPRPLDKYWSQPRCHPFLFRVDGKLAGFGLVEQRSRLSGDERVYDMDQFFVLRKYRHKGVGERAAAWLFDRFRGPWEVRQEAKNVAATAFWRRIVARYTGGRFEDLVLDDERWRGPVQRFDSTDTPSRQLIAPGVVIK